MRTITTCPGIGDFLWLAMKLQSTAERFKIVMSGGMPQRGHQVRALLPDLVGDHEYGPVIPYATVNTNSIQNTKRLWSQINEQGFYLSINSHLEGGKRIEEFLPDLDTSFRLRYYTTAEDKSSAVRLVPAGAPHIGLYTSAYNNSRNWGFWNEKQWFSLVRMLHKANKDFVFVVIGAEWDVDLSTKLIKLMKDNRIPHVNTVGYELGTVLECMRRFVYAFYFPSGLPILSETGGGSDCAMFYPPDKLPKMPGTWCDPRRRENGGFKECFFCTPEQIYDWVINTYQILDKTQSYAVSQTPHQERR